MVTDVCPSCGAPRTGSFRFCRTCGLDYDSAEPIARTAAPAILAEAAVAPWDASPLPRPEAGRQRPAGDVIVIQVRHLKLWAGAIIGGLIGAMLAGAIVVPLFGQELILFGSVAGLVTIVVSAWLGWRFVQLTARRSPGRS